ncbi:MAG: bamD [Proteobacteria bacterium]|nr:bamD [Pseudomonadota bacterium]
MFLLGLGLLGGASANVIQGIDISRVDDNAQIVIRFETEIQYLRHAPEREAKDLRVFFKVTQPGFSEGALMQEVLRSPASDLVPRFKVIYPELVNGMLIAFEKSIRFTLKAGGDAQSIVLLIPLPADKKRAAPAEKKTLGAPEKATAPVPVVVPEDQVPKQTPDAEKPSDTPAPFSHEQIESLATGFIGEARDALILGDAPKAVNRLNRLLGLPNNSQTENAQALIGEAREKNGEIAKARAEYELYLKLFPNGAAAPKVKERLAGLPKTDPVRRTESRVRRDDRPAEWTTFASLSTYWFNGQSKQDSGPMTRDQNTLISSLSVNARLRDSVTDTRFVFRDTDSRNFLRQDRDYNRIYSAYVERTDREVGYFVRAGRQNPNGAGVLERFDGVTGNYNLATDWKIGAVAGSVVSFPTKGFGGFDLTVNKRFYGANFEYLPQLGRPGASLYAIEQTLEGYVDRRALGTEIRYFDGHFSAFGTLDYDILYKGVNIGMAQANYTDPWGNSYFVNYDYRKSPTYSLNNALQSTSLLGITQVGALVDTYGIGQARKIVVDSTPTMSMFGTGVTVPVGEKWQFGFDFRGSKVSGQNVVLALRQICKGGLDSSAIGASATDPMCIGGPLGDVLVSQMCSGSYDPFTETCNAGQNIQGTTNTYTMQAIGTNLFVPGGVGVAMASFNKGDTSSGRNYGLTYVFPFAEAWRLEGSMRYFSSKSDAGSGQTNFSPSLKLGYQWRSAVFLETEIGTSDQRTTGTNPGTNKREYLYLGMRWDYR